MAAVARRSLRRFTNRVARRKPAPSFKLMSSWQPLHVGMRAPFWRTEHAADIMMQSNIRTRRLLLPRSDAHTGRSHVVCEIAMCRGLVLLPPFEHGFEIVTEPHPLEVVGDRAADFNRGRKHAARRRCVIAHPEGFFEIADRMCTLYSDGLPCGLSGER